MPLNTLQPLTLDQTSRYGIGGMQFYADHNSLIHPVKTIGGNLAVTASGGMGTVYQTLTINTGANEFATFVAKLKAAIETVIIRLLSVVNVNPGLYDAEEKRIGDGGTLNIQQIIDRLQRWDQLEIESLFDLEVFYQMSMWKPLVTHLFEEWDKRCVGVAAEEEVVYKGKIIKREVTIRRDKFFIAAFLDKEEVLPNYFVSKEGIEVYIDTVPAPQSHLTRINSNQGIWAALCACAGVPEAMYGPLWEYLYQCYSDPIGKVVTIKMLLAYLAHFGQSPFVSMERLQTSIGLKFDERILRMLTDIAFPLIMMKIWELTRKNIDLPDYKKTVRMTFIARKIDVSMFTSLMSVLIKDYAGGQITTVDMGLAHKAELQIFPFTRKLAHYHTSPENIDASETTIYGADEIYYEQYPAVSFIELDYLTDAPQPTDIEFVKIQNITSGTTQQLLASWNRQTNEIHMPLVDAKSAVGALAVVYPAFFNTMRPLTNAVDIKEEYWPVFYSRYRDANSPIVLDDTVQEFYMNQRSFFGPQTFFFNVPKSVELVPAGKKNGGTGLFLVKWLDPKIIKAAISAAAAKSDSMLDGALAKRKEYFESPPEREEVIKVDFKPKKKSAQKEAAVQAEVKAEPKVEEQQDYSI